MTEEQKKRINRIGDKLDGRPLILYNPRDRDDEDAEITCDFLGVSFYDGDDFEKEIPIVDVAEDEEKFRFFCVTPMESLHEIVSLSDDGKGITIDMRWIDFISVGGPDIKFLLSVVKEQQVEIERLMAVTQT